MTDSIDENPDAMRKSIARELAALGEEPLGEDELAFTRASSREDDGMLFDIDVATVNTLVGWASHEHDPGDDRAGQPDRSSLTEFARHRVWRDVQRRAQHSGTGPEHADPQPETASNSSSGGRGWGLSVIGLAVAAGVLLVPVLSADFGRSEPGAERVGQLDEAELQVLGEQARRGLDALPGPVGTERVESLAESYSKRLESRRGRG